MLSKREIFENNLIYVFNDLNYGFSFLDDYLTNFKNVDINILFGMMSHLLMIYYSSRDFFVRHEIKLGKNTKNLFDTFNDENLNNIRSAGIKLYTENRSWNNNLNHLEILKQNSLNYIIYLSNGHIIGNTHLHFFKQFDYRFDAENFTYRLASKFSIIKHMPQEWLCSLDHFKFDLKTENIEINFVKNENYNLNCVIAFLDVLSTLNLYYFYLRYNAIDKIIDFKIKYQTFVKSLNSVLNLNKSISEKKFLSNEEMDKLNLIKNKYIKNSLVNKTKHGNYIDNYTSVEDISNFKENNESLFVNMIEYLSGYNYNDFSVNIEQAIQQIILILEKHIFVKNKQLFIYFDEWTMKIIKL